MSFLKYQKQNPEFLNNYLKYTCYISFNAISTVNELYFDLKTFFRYIKLQRDNINIKEFKNIDIKDITLKDIDKVTKNFIYDFLHFLKYDLNNCPKTRNKKLSSLKNFFVYLFNNNLIHSNPTQGIKSATVEKRVPKYLTLNECKTMLSKTINSKNKFYIRDYAITCLFLNCGLRLSELVEINLTDLKLDENTLKIKGKGNCERIIYLNEASKESIDEYLKVRPTLEIDNKDYNALFISRYNKRLSKRTVQNIIENELYLTIGERNSGFHTHTLRHTSATLLYNENNTDIFIIKKILGHKSIASTEVYTHISNKKMREIMENYTISSILEKREEFSNE